MPCWLWRAVLGVTATTAALAVTQWASCTFYVQPTLWQLQRGGGAGNGSLTAPACEDAAGRSVATLMGLLTTLISLSRKSDES